MQEAHNAVASLKDAEQRPAVLNEAMQDIQQVTRTGSAAQLRGGCWRLGRGKGRVGIAYESFGRSYIQGVLRDFM